MGEKRKYTKIQAHLDENGKLIHTPSVNHPSLRGWKMDVEPITRPSERSAWKKGQDLSPDKDFWEK